VKRTIIYNGKHYELVHWHFSHLEAKDELGNQLLIKHSKNRKSMKAKIKDTIWRWFADEPMLMVHIRITFYIFVASMLIAGALMQVV
jgi:hypothetical protein